MPLEIEFQTQESDESDRATRIEQMFTEDAVADARRLAAPETHPDFDGKHCVNCDAKIPAARLALAKVRCVDCQSQVEQKQRMFR